MSPAKANETNRNEVGTSIWFASCHGFIWDEQAKASHQEGSVRKLPDPVPAVGAHGLVGIAKPCQDLLP